MDDKNSLFIIYHSKKGGVQVVWKGLAFGLIVIALGAGILLAMCLPPWVLVAILAFLLIVLGFILISGR